MVQFSTAGRFRQIHENGRHIKQWNRPFMKIGDFRFDTPDLVDPEPSVGPGAAPCRESIVAVFARIAAAHPERMAVEDEDASVRYGELDREARRIAGFITSLDLADETPVAVMIGRSWRYVAAILGILMARAAFVPLDPAMPLSRRRTILDQAGSPLLISETAQLRDMHRLQWACTSVADVLCLDSDDLDGRSEPRGALMSEELWDHLAGETDDDILAGGWKSAFTGQPIPKAAMEAFGANARAKIAPLVGPRSTVLEIGCASGFTLRAVAPMVARYMATDLSRRAIERTVTAAGRCGLPQVSGRVLAAHDIDVLADERFDLVIINSVIESFPGFGYLRDVLAKAAALLTPEGAIFIGHVRDLTRCDAYQDDLAAFARSHAGQDYQTRLDCSEDLFVPRAFFADWAAEQGDFAVTVSDMEITGFDAAPYGFDAVLHRLPSAASSSSPRRRRHDRRALAAPPPFSKPQPSPDALAYILFTSGTSGIPKGVMIEHRSVVNLAESVNATQFAPLGEALAVACVASFAFDGAVVQIFAALLGGHRLALPGEDAKRDPAALHAFIESAHLDVVDPTPSLFAMLLDHWQASGTASSARLFVMGGEVVPASLPERFFANPAHADTTLINAYGPTECCVAATQYVMTARNWREILPPPIGRPIRNVLVRIADIVGHPLPDGVAGEIRIGGAGVGRGYFAMPDATRQQFLTDADGQRWYRSGDLGRRLARGHIHFLGREDGQVKLRGNRIELSEVEAALAAYPFIRRAVVLPFDPPDGGDRVLAAYVVAAPGFDSGACRTEMETRLPSFMVPSWLVTVEDIPLTVNGKVDAARLPSPARSPRPRARRPLADDDEIKVAAIMGSVLNLVIDDADADFFTSGGHSVLAVQLVERLGSAFDLKLPLSDLFADSTVARLARRLRQRRHEASARSALVVVNDRGGESPLVCFHPVGGNVLCYQALAKALGDRQPMAMLEAQGLERGQTLRTTVEDMVAADLPLIRQWIGERPVRLAGWSFGGLLAVEAAYRLDLAGVPVRDVLLFDAVASPEPVRQLLAKDESDYLAMLFDGLGIADAETLRALSAEQRLDLMIERGRGILPLPDGIDRDAVRRLLAVFQNNALAAIRYRPPRLERLGALLVRPRVPSAQAPGIPGDDFNGWQACFGQPVQLEWMDGNHGQMLVPPQVDELAGHLRRYLARSADACRRSDDVNRIND
jgi:amino acid adenylation domain-containing protein